ncbi:MAG: ribulose-phosphate 3-epimerase [Bacteroidota bacterium]
MNSSHLVAPSVLAADFLKLGEAAEMMNQSQADWVHFDVMDGHFVPNISFGFPLLTALKRVSKLPLDVHLMISEPSRYLQAFRDHGADQITIHWEAERHVDRALHAIKDMGAMAGIALNPATPVDGLKHILPLVDTVLLMSVNPGFGGQKFIPYTLEKVRQLRLMMQEAGVKAHIEIDGGVDISNAGALLKAGADVLVAGSAVFKAEDPIDMIRQLKTLPQNQWV